MKKNTAKYHDTHCTVLEQRRLVKKMTQCDNPANNEDTYKCYLKVTKESRKNKACMYS